VVIPGITDGYVGIAPDIGAYEYGGMDWVPGHNFNTPPNPVFESVNVLYDNNVKQGGFENGVVAPWLKTYSGTAASVPDSRSCSKSVRLGTGEDGIKQVLSGLTPKTSYVCTVWAKVDSGDKLKIGVNNFGGTDTEVVSTSTTWTRVSIPFTTGAGFASATIYAYKQSGTSYAYVDDFGVVEK
jgi:hypothetical protein